MAGRHAKAEPASEPASEPGRYTGSIVIPWKALVTPPRAAIPIQAPEEPPLLVAPQTRRSFPLVHLPLILFVAAALGFLIGYLL